MGSKSIYDALGIIADFEDSLNDEGFETSKVQKHIDMMMKFNFRVPDFRPGHDWLNVSESLSFSKQLGGQLVILDFFTYCCINCMHILPDLKAVEDLFPLSKGVVVVGVHSAKFLNEKVTANIKSAVIRYDIQHPVVNDDNATLFQELAVSCWPTLIFVAPGGQLLYSLPGEGHRSKIMKFLEVAVDYFTAKGELKPQNIPVHLESSKLEKSTLSFPGKVTFWPERQWLLIADTGNNRVVITDINGVVQNVFGSGRRGFKDGSYSDAEFSSPQGVVGQGDYVYVADTENHSLRRISLSDLSVKTIAGTGKQGTDKIGGKIATEQELSSPWDLALGASPNEENEGKQDILYIAMAGTHQIWVYFLQDTPWYKTRYTHGTCLRFAGSGHEENRNNSYPEKASFAQPSGLALSGKNALNHLYIADSESSTVRFVDLSSQKVLGLVGGERDPSNLFAFGDVDGEGINGKLQHPLDVALLASDGPLVVADSYNHKIKIVDLKSSSCKTLAGTGQAGSQMTKLDLLKCELNEPGGLSVNQSTQQIYVADTNNHVIKVIDFKMQAMTQLPILFSQESKPKTEDVSVDLSGLQPLPDLTVTSSIQSVEVKVPLNLKDGEHINLEAPNSWKISPADGASKSALKDLPPSALKGNLKFSDIACPKEGYFTLHLPQLTQTMTLKITVQTFVCLDIDDMCLPPEQTHYKQIVKVS